MVVTVGFTNEFDAICGIIEINDRDTRYLEEEKLKYIKIAQGYASRTGFFKITLDGFYAYLRDNEFEFSIIEDFNADDIVDYENEFYV